jgi:hypothetical protein
MTPPLFSELQKVCFLPVFAFICLFFAGFFCFKLGMIFAYITLSTRKRAGRAKTRRVNLPPESRWTNSLKSASM